MVHIWSIYGPYTVHIWSIYGPYMVHIWSVYGPYMVQIWSIYACFYLQLQHCSFLVFSILCIVPTFIYFSEKSKNEVIPVSDFRQLLSSVDEFYLEHISQQFPAVKKAKRFSRRFKNAKPGHSNSINSYKKHG